MRRVFGFFVYHPEKTCPRCGSMHVHRTKRGRILEYWVLLFMPVRPYRCGKCRMRFYGPKKFADGQEFDDAAQSSSSHSESSRSSRR
jgi:transposase